MFSRILKFFLALVSFLTFSLRSQPSEVEIPIILSSNNTMYQSILYNLQLSLIPKTEIIYLNGFQDSEMKSYFVNLINKNPKFVITLGNFATLKTEEYLQDKIPVVFAMVNAPKLQGLEIGTKTCGIQTDIPISEIFSVLKEFRPNLKKVRGYSTNKISEFLLKEGNYQSSQFGLVMEIISINPKIKVTEENLRLNEDYDAIYIVPDPFYSLENLELISNVVKRQNKILATQVPYMVNLGTTFSITPFFARVGSQLADLSNKVWNNRVKCKDGLTYALKEFYFQINREYTESSNVYIPLNLEQRVKNSNLLLEGIQYFELENYELSNLIMKKILKSDETNPTALYYQTEIARILHGSKVKEYLEKADSAKEKGNFSLEREYLEKILKLEPQNEKVSQRILESKELESEREMKQAERLERNADPFLAIQRYMTAISIYPNNRNAIQKLSTLRSRLASSIPILFSNAKIRYEERDYNGAIDLLKKILLIDPNYKSALEYLRLAQDKKTAMNRIKECLDTKNKNCYLLWSK